MMSVSRSSELIISKKFVDSVFDTKEFLCYISPYSLNNIIIVPTKSEEKTKFEIYKYIFDPLEPELKFVLTLESNEIIRTTLMIDLKIFFIFPGRVKNEIFILTQDLEIWRSVIDLNKQLKNCELIIKIQNSSQLKYINELLNELTPDNIFLYFSNQKIIGIVIILGNECVFFLEKVLDEDEDIYTFTFEKFFLSEDNGNLYIILYSEKNGVSVINTTEKLARSQFPFHIKKFDQFNYPLDINIKNQCLYILQKKRLLKFPYLNKKKGSKKCEFSSNIIATWFNPTNSIQYIITREENQYSLKHVILTSAGIKFILRHNDEYDDILPLLKLSDNNFRIVKLKNAYFGFLYNESQIVSWSNIRLVPRTAYDGLSLKFKFHYREEHNALNSLRKLQGSGYDLNGIVKMFEDALPVGLKSRRSIRKKSYTCEDDLFILEHIYKDMTISQISESINHPRNSVSARFMNSYGTPSCDEHYQFKFMCIQCQQSLVKWKSEVREKIISKEYNVRVFTDMESDLSYSRKERYIRNQTLELRSKLTPEIYDGIVKFLSQIDCSGRSFQKLFVQCLRLFIGKYIEEIGFQNIKPSQLLSLFCDIKPDFKRLRYLRGEFMKVTGKNPFRLSGNEILFLHAVNSFSKIYNKSTEEFNNLFLDTLKLFKHPKVGTIPALIYTIFNKTFTQKEVSEAFGITEVTLRKEVRNIKDSKEYLDLIQIHKKLIFKIVGFDFKEIF